jgi:uncharacterized membrane protein (DUF2068 family)
MRPSGGPWIVDSLGRGRAGLFAPQAGTSEVVPLLHSQQRGVGEELKPAPGSHAARGRRRRRLNYELISCGFGGHELAGTDAEQLRTEDAIFARPAEGGYRWYRCLRCDSWVVLAAPERPSRRYPPPRDQIELPLRGRPLRDKYVLRLIAIDRALHFLILGTVAIAIFAFLSHRTQLRGEFYKVLIAIHGSLGGPTSDSHSTILGDVRKLFALKQSSLFTLGIISAAYALLEGVEAVGLWLRRRWAEYLTFIATAILLVPEIYELTGKVSVFKILALIINILVVAYLLFAKRLFGLRGGGRAEQAEIERDSGWPALESALPGPPGAPILTGVRQR